MKLQLQASGKKYQGWENVSITKSMDSIAHRFSMDIYKDGDNVIIEDDEVIKIYVDDKVFFTGYLDDNILSITDVKKPLKINGRSKAGDLIDCNILTNKQYSKLNAKQIIEDLIKPFGISVSTTLSLEPLETFNTEVGETYFNAINRLCKQTNTLPISDVNGNLLIVKNENNITDITLTDKDFKSITFPRKLSNRFSEYVYKKEGIVTDVTDGKITDDTIGRFRPFVDINTEDKSNIDMAKWKKNNDQAKAIQLSGVVVGWDLEINTIVKIETDFVSSSFLIKDITYTKGDNGTISTVTFVSKDLYNVWAV